VGRHSRVVGQSGRNPLLPENEGDSMEGVSQQKFREGSTETEKIGIERRLSTNEWTGHLVKRRSFRRGAPVFIVRDGSM